jgi:hypothetical protein
MRKFLVALAIGFCCFSARGQKTRLQQEVPHAKPGVIYPIKVHVSGVHYRTEYAGGGLDKDVTYMDALMEGKKVELQVSEDAPPLLFRLSFQRRLFSLGDYQARLLKDPHKTNDTPLFREYELRLPDNTISRFTVTGISE